MNKMGSIFQKNFARLVIFIWIFLGRCLPFGFKISALFFHFKQKSDYSRLKERFGRSTVKRSDNKIFWLHASSLGEISQVVTLVKKLKSKFEIDIIITTATQSGSDFVHKNLPDCTHQFAPFDSVYFYKSFINFWKPDCVVILENDMWPSMLSTLFSKNIPIFMVNVRTSKSFKKFPSIYSNLLAKISRFHCRTDVVADQLKDLGVSDDLILKGGDLKSVEKLPQVDTSKIKELASAFSGKKVLIAASTHKTDEKIVLEAFKVINSRKNWVLVLAPRHPKRASDIIKSIKKYDFKVYQRSLNNELKDDCQVYVADTLGELGILFELGNIVYLGGGMGSEGGHNPFEPGRLGKAIISGPNVENFAYVFDALVTANACIFVKNKKELINSIKFLEVSKRSIEMGKAAEKILNNFSDPTENIVNLIDNYLTEEKQSYG